MSVIPGNTKAVADASRRWSPARGSMANPASRDSLGTWTSALLVLVYYVIVWNPPVLEIADRDWYGWYVPLGLALAAVVFRRRLPDTRQGGFFWSALGLSFAGAVISLLRAHDVGRALWNTVGLGINYVAYLLFIPVVASLRSRKLILLALMVIAFLWTIEIQRLLSAHGQLVYATFAETGSNKNAIGFVMAIASTAAFSLATVWRPAVGMPGWSSWVGRGLLVVLGGWLLYSVSLIYARTAILSGVLGIGSVLVLIHKRIPNKLWATAIVGLLGLALYLIVAQLLPWIVQTSPQWTTIMDRYGAEGLDALSSRRILLAKGWYIVQRNPFLGVGLGGTKDAITTSYVSFPDYYIHNLYLTDWAEKGILGLLSNAIWILAYYRVLRRTFPTASVTDRVWLLLMLPVFFATGFKDMSSITLAMLVVLSGIYVDHMPAPATQAGRPAVLPLRAEG